MIAKHGDEGAFRMRDRLEDRIASLLPEWRSRGPEDPGRVLLEAFASALAEIEGDRESLSDRWLEKLLAELGEEARPLLALRSAVAFTAAEGLERAIRIPAGAGLSGSRETFGDDGETQPRAEFQTLRDAWLSPAILRRAFALEGDRVTELPQRALTSEVRRADDFAETRVFHSRVLDRNLYLGDEAWEQLRMRSEEILLEWSASAFETVCGRWEYSVRGGWRALPVELEETVNHRGERMIRQRILGPLPDMESRRLHGSKFPWIRLSLEHGHRVQLSPPMIAWVPGAQRRGKGDTASPRTPRSIARVVSRAAERVEDHSFSHARRMTAAALQPDEFPSLYFGLDLPLPSSLFWSAGGLPLPPGAAAPEFVWECSTVDGFRQLSSAELLDDTASLSRSGTLSWGLLDDWVATEIFDARLCWIRARWVSGRFYSAPRLRSLYSQAVEIVEGRISEDVRVDLEVDPSTQRADIVLPVEGGWEPFSEMRVETTPGHWEPLSRADGVDRLRAGRFRLRRRPDGRSVIEFSGEFGGKLRARIPKLRTSLGLEGHGVSIDTLESDIDALRSVTQIVPTFGADAVETVGDMARRVRAEWKSGFRAVTGADYRRIAMAIDPFLARVEVICRDERPAEVVVVVLPRPPCIQGRIGPGRLEYLRSYLSSRSPLGSVVHIVEPAYLHVKFAIDADIDTHSDASDIDSLWTALEADLRSFCDPLGGGPEGAGFPLAGLEPERLHALLADHLREFSWRQEGGEAPPLLLRFRAVAVHGVSGLPDTYPGDDPLALTLPVFEGLWRESIDPSDSVATAAADDISEEKLGERKEAEPREEAGVDEKGAGS